MISYKMLRVLDAAKNIFIENAPDISLFSDNWSLIEGKYYQYQDIAQYPTGGR